MYSCNQKVKIIRSFFVFLLVTFSLSYTSFAQDAAAGKAIFMAKCAACHNVMKDGTGPALKGVEDRHKWADHKEILSWVNNPGGYMAKDAYTQGLKAKFGSMMTAFPDVTLKDVDDIVAYINETANKKPDTPAAAGAGQDDSSRNSLIYGIIAVILAIILFVFMQVNKNLRKYTDEAQGIEHPTAVPFYRNKTYLALASIFLFILGGFWIAKGAIGLGRQKNYMPKQPIFYSHKVHAGINQVNCLYCHGNAMQSKAATIPAINVCMNCHLNIKKYEKGPQLFDAEGNMVDGTAEIAKLYQYAGFDPQKDSKWDPSKAKPIEWVKIHNMPDHVFFSHAQHVNAGKVQCQSCHGEVTAMDEVSQFSELSMGWCVNCHRNTKVNFNKDSTGNKFYSIYEKFHDDIKSGKMDSVTVKDIGGLECQKCHY